MKTSGYAVAIKFWSAVGLLFLLGGCVTTGGALFSMPDVPPPGHATLVVYRVGLFAPQQDFRCYVNDTLIARLGPNTYSYTYVKEGQHRVRWGIYAGESRGDSSVGMVAGETYFYRATIERSAPVPILPVLAFKETTTGNFVEPAAAKEELANKRYVQAAVPSL